MVLLETGMGSSRICLPLINHASSSCFKCVQVKGSTCVSVFVVEHLTILRTILKIELDT